MTNLSQQDYALVEGLGDNDVKVQRRWDFESIQGRAFFWNDDRGGFDAENGEYIGDEAVYRQPEKAVNNRRLASASTAYYLWRRVRHRGCAD